MPGGFIERMKRIADHLGDGWVVETLSVESGGVGVTVQYAHSSERRIRWTVGPDGQRVTLRSAEGRVQTWLNAECVRASRGADAIQGCAWFVERELTPLDDAAR